MTDMAAVSNAGGGGKQYDVAISFLVRDEPTAKELAERLERGLEVFFFPHNQEELAGTNGLESMREPFLSARVVVVLFRMPWGQTPWTRVEETAIGERSLKRGWSSLLFVQLDKASTFPKWLPETHIRFSYEDYGIDQLVGAIKLRVQEQGGTIERPDAMAEAGRVQREADYLADRKRFMEAQRWIQDVVHVNVRETIAEVGRLADEANSTHRLTILHRAHGTTCVLRSKWVSIGIEWRQPIINSVTDVGSNECYLGVTEFSGMLALPGENRWFVEQPRRLKEHKFKVDVSQARALVWREKGGNDSIEPDRLADTILRILLGLISRANQGKVSPPD